jgi:hypothetical protein
MNYVANDEVSLYKRGERGTIGFRDILKCLHTKGH